MMNDSEINEFRERLVRIETISIEKFENVKQELIQIKSIFSEVFNEIKNLPCSDRKSEIDNNKHQIDSFKKELSYTVKLSESRIKRWIFAGVFSVLTSCIVACVATLVPGFFGKLFN